jgi:outer membrane lipoprotein-sorting protein
MKNQSEMRTKSVILLFALFNLTIIAQKDPEAIKILSEFSKKATSAPAVSIDFSFLTNDSSEGSLTTIEGSVVIAGDRYRLSLPDNTVWADGKTAWSYLPDVNEVTITATDPDDESFITRPSLLFSLYDEGYKVRLLEQTANEWTIDLYPEDLTVNLIRIRLKIGKSAYDLRSAEYKAKDGITVTLKVKKYDLAFKPAASYFIFNPADYKNVDIIDMR